MCFLLPVAEVAAINIGGPGLGEEGPIEVDSDPDGSFSFSYTAEDYNGEVSWYFEDIVVYEDVDDNREYVSIPSSGTAVDYDGVVVNIIATTGNTATISGTIPSKYSYFTATLVANDSTSGEGLGFFVRNSSFSNGDDANSVPYDGDNEDNTTQAPVELNVGRIQAVELNDDVLEQLAANISIDKGKLHLLTAADFNPATPQEPTQAMRDQVANDGYEFVAKLNEVTISEDGYYVFQITVDDELVDTQVSDLKLYYAEASDFDTSSIKAAALGLIGLINGVAGSMEVSNFLGIKLDTMPKHFLATMFLYSSKSMTVYIAKVLLLLLGGCAVGGFGIVAVSGFLVWKFYRAKKDKTE